MPSCRVILKKLVRDKRITIDEYDKLLRNLKPQIDKEDAIAYLHQIRWMQAHDKEIYKQGYECGKNERKTGTWKKILIATVPFTIYGYECPFCEFRTPTNNFNFCPHCGEKLEINNGKWVEVHLSHPRYGGDAVIYRCSICGWAVDHKVPKCRCGAEMEVDE